MDQVIEIQELNRTHYKLGLTFAESLDVTRNKIVLRGDLPHAPVMYQLEILDQLCDFSLGKFILERKGANGFWTDYMLSHPENGGISGVSFDGKPFTPLEDFLLNRCPVVVAHQERFRIFQRLTQEILKKGMILASVPCGVMRDLLTLDFSGINDFQLIGIDIDEESLLLASKLANEKSVGNCKFIQQNAWQIHFENELDVITSSGLNVYESDRNKVLDLYKKFFTALKPGGFLITSVLTYPPGDDIETDWDLSGISYEDLLLDRILHKDILDIKWRNFRSSHELCDNFRRAGFSEVSVFFDKHHIFPTILAKK